MDKKTDLTKFEGIPLWQDREMIVFLPVKPLIHPQDGIHFYILFKNAQNVWWKAESSDLLLKGAKTACLIGKIIITNGLINDFWANIQWSARPFFNKGVNVFGRNPESLNWGQPLRILTHSKIYHYSTNYIRRLKNLLARQLIFKKEQSLILFSEGIKDFKQGSAEFTQAEEIFSENKPPKKKKDILWVNEKFILTIPRQPHLEGLHLQVFPRFAYWQKKEIDFRAPWQLSPDSLKAQLQIQGYLEMTAILLGAVKIILEDKKILCFNPEIHFSNNWHKDLQPIERGGRLQLEYLSNIKNKPLEERIRIITKEKSRYWLGEENEFRVTGHGHLYATNSEKEFVRLPSRPFEESPEEWPVVSFSQAKIIYLRKLLQDDLTAWLNQYCQGLAIDMDR